MDGQHDAVLEIVPVLVRELDSQADQLLGEAVTAGDFEALIQVGCDGALVLVPVLPEHGVAAILAALGVGHVEHIAQEYPAVPVAQQGDSLGAAPDLPVHPLFPEVVTGTGCGILSLDIDHQNF